ncbi:MAG: WxcM-like domain-containing protein [Candidatus Heimdallarchaeota archaeon]
MKNVEIIDCPAFVDDRGWLVQIYEKVDLPEMKRMYLVSNFDKKLVRAFHKNFNETKLFYVIKGSVKFILSDGKETKTIVISSKKPQLLVIGSEIWNGWRSLEDETLLLGFASTTMAEHKDERCPPDSFKAQWDVLSR